MTAWKAILLHRYQKNSTWKNITIIMEWELLLICIPILSPKSITHNANIKWKMMNHFKELGT